MAAAATRLRLLLADLVMSFLWVWAGVLAKLAALRLPDEGQREAARVALSVVYMFFFALLEKVTHGGAYNPLTAVAGAVADGGLLFTAFVRIPVEVAGSVLAVRVIRQTIPNIGYGARLNARLHYGALAEGLATFVVVMVSATLKKKEPKSFFMKTWITSIMKMALHILSSDLTGGIMNPASAFGWAFARGDHVTLDHLFVYWLAPVQATLLAIWAVNLSSCKEKKPEERNAIEKKTKSE